MSSVDEAIAEVHRATEAILDENRRHVAAMCELIRACQAAHIAVDDAEREAAAA